MKSAARSQSNPNFIKMFHGNLEINVPRKMFRQGAAELVPSEVEAFRQTLQARYPWLSKYALDDVVKGAQAAMSDHIERSKSVPQRAREHIAAGRTKVALKILEEHLIEHEDDAEAWYVTAEVLFKLGKPEDGFRAMSRARDLSELSGKRVQ